MYKAIGHCRVSKGDADEIKNSLKSQQSEILKLAARLNINENEIDWVIEEEARSSYSTRANWSIFENAVKMACSNPNIKYFLDYSQERFCRNKNLSQKFKEKLRNHNVQVRFASGDVEDPDSNSGFWMDGIQEMAAEFQSRKIGDDTLRGCKENATTRDPETGYTYKNGGSAPFWLKAKKVSIGTEKCGDDIRKTIWVENDKIHSAMLDGKMVSKTMWEWSRYYFIELRINQKFGVEKARDILNELEIPAPRGKYWATTCLYSAECNEDSLLGIGTYNKKQFARNGNGRIKDESEWIREIDAHPAILNQDEVEALKSLRKCKLKRQGTISRFQSNNEHLLIGYPDRFTCKSCGGKIISSGNVYTCGRYNTNGRKGCGASYFSVSSDWLENKILDEIFKSLSDKEIRKYYKDFAQYYTNDNKAKEQVKNLKKALNDKEKAQINLIASLTGLSNMNEYAIKAISQELDKTAKEVDDLRKEIANSSKVVSIKIPVFETFKTHLLRAKLLLTRSNLAEKRDLIFCFINSITLDPIEREVIVDFNSDPFSVMLEMEKNPKNKVEGVFTPSTKLVAGAGFEPTTFGL